MDDAVSDLPIGGSTDPPSVAASRLDEEVLHQWSLSSLVGRSSLNGKRWVHVQQSINDRLQSSHP
ncbi:MAG: hypothetical protein VX668_12440, partial [Planctomycetota bacterium]|nr:hypothetical protein [Planctomycetota bacterium]